MKGFRIVVKGNRQETEKALLDRGIPGTFVGESRLGYSMWDIDQQLEPLLSVWFGESSTCLLGSEFPIGTLLHTSRTTHISTDE